MGGPSLEGCQKSVSIPCSTTLELSSENPQLARLKLEINEFASTGIWAAQYRILHQAKRGSVVKLEQQDYEIRHGFPKANHVPPESCRKKCDSIQYQYQEIQVSHRQCDSSLESVHTFRPILYQRLMNRNYGLSYRDFLHNVHELQK